MLQLEFGEFQKNYFENVALVEFETECIPQEKCSAQECQALKNSEKFPSSLGPLENGKVFLDPKCPGISWLGSTLYSMLHEERGDFVVDTHRPAVLDTILRKPGAPKEKIGGSWRSSERARIAGSDHERTKGRTSVAELSLPESSDSVNLCLFRYSLASADTGASGKGR